MFETATDIIKTMLAEYGLTFSQSELNSFLNRISDNPDEAPIVLEEIRQSEQFAERFPAISQRVENGYAPISPGDYIRMESLYRASIRQAGLPMSFYDEPDELAEFIANDVAPDEFESRIADGFIAAEQAPQEVRDALVGFYGVPVENVNGALAAYYLDPDRALPAIERQMQAARIAGAATMTGFGSDQTEAERLTELGVGVDEAMRGFANIMQDEGVLSSNLGRGTDFTRDQRLQAQFEMSAGLNQAIQRQRAARLSEFAGEARASVSQQGLTAFQNTSGVPAA